MASEATRPERAPDHSARGAALQHSPWRSLRLLSRALAGFERFLADSGFDRAPWLAVAFAAGIGAWFALPMMWHWLALVALCLGGAMTGLVAMRADGSFPFVRRTLMVVPLLVAAGCLTVWAKSSLVAAPAIDRPTVTWLQATVLDRQEQPAENRVRLVLATRHPHSGDPVRIRLNLPDEFDRPDATVSSRIRVRARLMPPAPPMLPGGYDFARAAWFAGLSASGSVLEPVQVIQGGQARRGIDNLQAWLSRHVRERIDGSSGSIAATLASGDRGAIDKADAQAMRDSGLAHLLSISGLHVSAVIAGAYFLAIRLFALWPWLALRVRLPVLAAGAGALAGIFYTLLTGAQVPTVRSCIGAVLVLLALALGREALSLRMLAVAAFAVLLLWPESLVGPSFQMSFAAVMAIVALHRSDAVRRFLAPREEGWLARGLRYVGMLFLTGVVIEIVLMPIGLYHFHRSGVYGAFANVIAIPLTTVVVMPLIALALLLDLVMVGSPIWWLAGKAVGALLGLAHWVSAQPGAVTVLPAMGGTSFLLFIAGGLWLALWHGKIRFLGLIPAAISTVSLATLGPPDILVSSDGRHVGITGGGVDDLLVLRDSRSDFVRDNLTELAGMNGKARLLAEWDGARCSPDFCAVRLERGEKAWRILIARSRDRVPERALAAAQLSSVLVQGGQGDTLADRLPGYRPECAARTFRCRWTGRSWLVARRPRLNGRSNLKISVQPRGTNRGPYVPSYVPAPAAQW